MNSIHARSFGVSSSHDPDGAVGSVTRVSSVSRPVMQTGPAVPPVHPRERSCRSSFPEGPPQRRARASGQTRVAVVGGVADLGQPAAFVLGDGRAEDQVLHSRKSGTLQYAMRDSTRHGTRCFTASKPTAPSYSAFRTAAYRSSMPKVSSRRRTCTHSRQSPSRPMKARRPDMSLRSAMAPSHGRLPSALRSSRPTGCVGPPPPAETPPRSGMLAAGRRCCHRPPARPAVRSGPGPPGSGKPDGDTPRIPACEPEQGRGPGRPGLRRATAPAA